MKKHKAIQDVANNSYDLAEHIAKTQTDQRAPSPSTIPCMQHRSIHAHFYLAYMYVCTYVCLYVCMYVCI
jgi:hypothetical protein